jgi:hypothetical protein
VKAWVPVLVVFGVAACAGAALSAGLDAMGIGVLVAIVGIGAAAIAATRKMRRIEPGRCDECGGLVSLNAPYCKHCGARLARAATSRTGS